MFVDNTKTACTYSEMANRLTSAVCCDALTLNITVKPHLLRSLWKLAHLACNSFLYSGKTNENSCHFCTQSVLFKIFQHNFCVFCGCVQLDGVDVFGWRNWSPVCKSLLAGSFINFISLGPLEIQKDLSIPGCLDAPNLLTLQYQTLISLTG